MFPGISLCFFFLPPVFEIMKCAAKVIEICTISWDASRCVCVRVCVYVRVLHKVVLTVSLIRQSRPYGSGRRAGHLNGVVCPVVVSVVVGVWQPCGVSRIISFLKAFPWGRGFPFVES